MANESKRRLELKSAIRADVQDLEKLLSVAEEGAAT
jgi:hypothetical protein